MNLLNQTSPLLASLNPEQYQACSALEGPLLVLAGAGTGKTRVLTTRMAHLIMSGKAQPHQILAVTFTNKAASEMRERIEKLLGKSESESESESESASGGQFARLNVGTFHSLSARFLRPLAETVGLSPNFTILDMDDQIRLVRELLDDMGVDDNQKNYARSVIFMIDRWKNKAWSPADIPEAEQVDLLGSDLPEIYEAYQNRLQQLNAVDFGDLLLHMVNIWKNHADILAQFHRRFQYILVDEYQDTNVAQYLWLRLLAQKNRNICCVGDDDQAIYSWRGAEITNILRFEKDYAEANTIRLQTNYRSTGHILKVASGLIAHNKGRMGKTLYSNDEMGEKVRLCQLFSGDEEANYVANEVVSLAGKKIPFNEMAILVRTGAQTRAFEESLLHAGVAYQIVGGLRFYEREEIRDMIAYLRIVSQDNDDLALLRILNKPTRGIGGASIQILRKAAMTRKIPIYQLMKNQLDEVAEIKTRTQKSCNDFVEMIEEARAMLVEKTLPEVTDYLIKASHYDEYLQKMSDKIKRQGKQENLRELLVAQTSMADLAAFLEHISLVMDGVTRSSESVYLMTIHAAKGLEFDSVFLPGWEDGLFPSQRTIEESGEQGLEEERRLAYVALTRAKKRSYISCASGRRLYGQWHMARPSRFIAELPLESVENLKQY